MPARRDLTHCYLPWGARPRLAAPRESRARAELSLNPAGRARGPESGPSGILARSLSGTPRSRSRGHRLVLATRFDANRGKCDHARIARMQREREGAAPCERRATCSLPTSPDFAASKQAPVAWSMCLDWTHDKYCT